MKFYFREFVELVQQLLRRSRTVLPVNQLNRPPARYMPAVLPLMAMSAEIKNVALVFNYCQRKRVADFQRLLARYHRVVSVRSVSEFT